MRRGLIPSKATSSLRLATGRVFRVTTSASSSFAALAARCGLLSLRSAIEISQIWRRLVLADRHQQPVGTREVILPADDDHRVVLSAVKLDPVRTRIAIVHIFFVHGPRPRQGMVDDGYFVMKDVQVDLIASHPFLNDGQIVDVEGKPGGVVDAIALERTA